MARSHYCSLTLISVRGLRRGGRQRGRSQGATKRLIAENRSDFYRLPCSCRREGVYSNPSGRGALRAVLALLLTVGRAAAKWEEDAATKKTKLTTDCTDGSSMREICVKWGLDGFEILYLIFRNGGIAILACAGEARNVRRRSPYNSTNLLRQALKLLSVRAHGGLKPALQNSFWFRARLCLKTPHGRRLRLCAAGGASPRGEFSTRA
jgi:hypothetical protein